MTSGEPLEAREWSAPTIRCKAFFQDWPTGFWTQTRSYRTFFIVAMGVTHANVRNSITANQVWRLKMIVCQFGNDFQKKRFCRQHDTGGLLSGVQNAQTIDSSEFLTVWGVNHGRARNFWSYRVWSSRQVVSWRLFELRMLFMPSFCRPEFRLTEKKGLDHGITCICELIWASHKRKRSQSDEFVDSKTWSITWHFS